MLFWVKHANSLKLNAASHNDASWYTDTDWFLEHSSSRGSLYYQGPTVHNIIPGILGSPLTFVIESEVSECSNKSEVMHLQTCLASSMKLSPRLFNGLLGSEVFQGVV